MGVLVVGSAAHRGSWPSIDWQFYFGRLCGRYVCNLRIARALAWTAATIALLVQVDLRKTVIGIGIGMVPLAIAFAIMNDRAHGDLRPPYAHRAVGELVSKIDLPKREITSPLERLSDAKLPIFAAIRAFGAELADSAEINAVHTWRARGLGCRQSVSFRSGAR